MEVDENKEHIDYSELDDIDAEDEFELTPDKVQNPLVHYIWRQLNINNSNFIGVFIGKPGSGKSWSALRLAERVSTRFNVDYVVYSVNEFMNLINQNKLKKGDMVIFDEAGISINSKQWYSLANKVVNMALQTVRNRNFGMLFTVPFSEYVDSSTRKLFNNIFIAKKIDNKSKKAVFKVQTIKYNIYRAKYYFKPLMLKINNRLISENTVRFSMPSRKLRKEYELKKMKFQEKLYSDLTDELETGKHKTQDKSKEQQKKERIVEAIKMVEPIFDDFIRVKNNKRIIDINLLETQFGFSTPLARKVKVYLEKKYGLM